MLLKNRMVFFRASHVAYLALFLSFMPFFSIFPLSSTDVQPLFFLVIIFYFLVGKKFLRPNHIVEYYLIFLVFYSSFYINFYEGQISIKELLILLLVLVLYFFYKSVGFLLNEKLLFYLVAFNFLGIFFHFFFPDFFVNLFSGFVREVKILDTTGIRGASGFATEPGLMGGLIAFWLALLFYLKDFKLKCSNFYVVFIALLLMVLATKSGTAFLFVFSFLFFRYFSLRTIIFIIPFSFFIIFFLSSLEVGRASQFAQVILDFNLSYFFLDQSIAQRLFNITIGFLSVVEYPFGLGVGMYEYVRDNLISSFSFLSSFDLLSLGNVSSFAELVIRSGIFGVFFLFLILIYSIKNKTFHYFFLFLLFLSAGYSLFFPPIWFLLYIILQQQNKIIK